MKKITFLICLLIGVTSYAQTVTVNFSVDTNGGLYPDATFPSMALNGTFAPGEEWWGWGVALTDDDTDGIWTGSRNLAENSSFEFVVAGSGEGDGWSGWGVSSGYSALTCGDVGGNYLLSTTTENLDVTLSVLSADDGAGFWGGCMTVQTATGGGLALPFDFESEPVTGDFIDFDGAGATVIPNPQSVDPNTSTNVAQIIRNGGATWAGSKIVLASNLDFSSLGGISMKVFTTAPIGTTVKFKLEGAGETEQDRFTTVSGAWETLTWDFTGQPANFNTVVFMFDFGNVGDGSATSTFLFDDIEQFDASGGLSQIDLPVNFEGSLTNYTMTDFGGNTSSLVADPNDSGNMVMRAIKANDAADWAGTTIGTATGFATNIPLTLASSKMYVRVWSPDAGTPIRLKVEDSSDPTHTCETETLTTQTAAWEVLEFDFANEAPGTAALSFGLANGWIYNKASLFFNFGTFGADAGEKTYYFDNVAFANPLGINEFELASFLTYPNPTEDHWTIKTRDQQITDVQLFDMFGKMVTHISPNNSEVVIDASYLSTGIYFAKINTVQGVKSIKLVKK